MTVAGIAIVPVAVAVVSPGEILGAAKDDVAMEVEAAPMVPSKIRRTS